ncbi:MAG TPA: acyltransferase family protein, partial [Acidimicrobiales bacterium]
PAELARIRADGIASLLYAANWHAIVAGTGYWDLFAAPSPLEHLWSLAIEEQFYLLWPVVVLVVLRVGRGSARVLLAVSLTLAALSATAMWFLYDPADTARAYLGTDTRGAAILLGAALACAVACWGLLEHRRAIRALDLAGLVALGGLGVSWATLDGQSRLLYRGGFWLTELAVVILIACAAHGERSLVARGLTWRPFIWCGLISYGLYLWHWPIYVLLSPSRVPLPGAWLTVLRLVVTFGVAVASYRFLEQPIRRHGLPTRLHPAVLVTAGVVVAAVTLVLATSGSIAPSATQEAGGGRDLSAWPTTSLSPAGGQRLLVVGDSVATSLGPLLDAGAGTGFEIAARGVPDCSLLDAEVPTHSPAGKTNSGGDCAKHWSQDLDELHPSVTLVVLGGGYLALSQIDGEWQRPCQSGWHDTYTATLIRRLAMLRDRGTRVDLALVPQPLGPVASDTSPERVACFNAALTEAAGAVPGTRLIDLRAPVCPDGPCPVTIDGETVREDGLHFSGAGGQRVADWILAHT